MTKQVRIKAANKRGKQVLKEAGTDVWFVLQEADMLPMGDGPWFLVSPTESQADPLCRWALGRPGGVFKMEAL